MRKIQGFDFDIEYVKGKHNIVVDALSRRPKICSLSKISSDRKEHLLVEYSKKIFSCQLMDGQVQDDMYKVVDDIHLLQVQDLSGP